MFGQPDFATVTTGLAADNFNSPQGVFLTPDDSLWVTDTNNNLLLRFSNASTMANGSAADRVVGQSDFTANTAGITDRTMDLPRYSPFVDATGSLWVPDSNNNHVLLYQPDVTKPLFTLTGTVPKKINKKTVIIKGTASDTYGILKVKYRIGTGALKTASGTTSWQFTALLKKGKNTIIATDSVGNVSLSKIVKVQRS